jgi:TPP-dependent pyruvate/acetoin dehydrogenase alpha subunit
MGTALERSESETRVARKAESYRVPAATVDGMDVLAVEAAAASAVSAIRAGSGPQLLELATYRFRAHSMFDPELYRDKAEVERWKQRDPIVTLEKRLRAASLLADADLAAIEADVGRELAAAVDFDERGTLEPVAELATDVYARQAAR